MGVRTKGLGDGLEDAVGVKENTDPAHKLGATQDCRGKPLAAQEVAAEEALTSRKSQVLVRARTWRGS